MASCMRSYNSTSIQDDRTGGCYSNWVSISDCCRDVTKDRCSKCSGRFGVFTIDLTGCVKSPTSLPQMVIGDTIQSGFSARVLLFSLT